MRFEVQSTTVNFRLVVPKNSECKTATVSRDLNPPIESKLSRDNLDSNGGFKSRDTLQFCIPSLDGASNLKNTVASDICGIHNSKSHEPMLIRLDRL